MDADIEKKLQGPWHIGGEPVLKAVPLAVDPFMMPYVNDPEMYSRYCDDVVYQADKAIRDWMEVMSEVPDWLNFKKNRTYRFTVLWEILFGEAWKGNHENARNKKIRTVSRVFAYYCSEIHKTSYDPVKDRWTKKCGYVIDPSRRKLPPYSLKLRIEWLRSQGKIPREKDLSEPEELLPGERRKGKRRRTRIEDDQELLKAKQRREFNAYQNEYKARKRELGAVDPCGE